MALEYVRQHYNVPAEIGRRVIVNGKPGVIVKDCGTYIGVVFDADEPDHISPCHPTWEVQYGKMSAIRQIKHTKSQRRAAAYRNCDFSDCFGGFIGFCEW